MKKRTLMLLIICISAILLSILLVFFYNSGKAEIPYFAESIREETIIVPELKKSYDFLFITDQHMVKVNENASDRELEYATMLSGGFMDENKVPSREQFVEWIEYSNDLYREDKLDAFLMGGDMISFPSEDNLENLEMDLHKLEAPYLYTMGNHDWNYEWDYMSEKSEQEYLPKFDDIVQENHIVQHLDFEEIRIISVDDSSNQINPEVLDDYEKLLDTDKKVIVMLHVPLLTQSVLSKAKVAWDSPTVLGGGNYGGIYPDSYSEKFISMTTAEDSPVIAVLAGHVHFADRDMINSKIVQIVGDAGYMGSATLIHIESDL